MTYVKPKRPKSKRFRVWVVGETATHVYTTNAATARQLYAKQKNVSVHRVRVKEE